MRSKLFNFIRRKLLAIGERRVAAVQIGDGEDIYLNRWYLLPRNPVFNVYLHQFLRSDDDRALHDHPWSNLSILLDGVYIEHTISSGGVNHRRVFRQGEFKLRLSGKYAHRVELIDNQPCWTLFLTGPRYRRWGFHCPNGWRYWKEFVSSDDRHKKGAGCD